MTGKPRKWEDLPVSVRAWAKAFHKAKDFPPWKPGSEYVGTNVEYLFIEFATEEEKAEIRRLKQKVVEKALVPYELSMRVETEDESCWACRNLNALRVSCHVCRGSGKQGKKVL